MSPVTSKALFQRGLALTVVVMAAGCPDIEHRLDAGGKIAPSPTAAAHVVRVDGQVFYEHQGQRFDAKPAPFFLGDALETGENGSATVRLAMGREIEISANARFVLDETNEGLVLNVARGLVISRLEGTSVPDGAVTLSILTPFGLTRLSGEDVTVEVTLNGATVGVKVGSIQWISRNGKAVTVTETVELDALGFPKEKALTPAELKVSALRGRTEVKKNGAKNWSPVAAKSPAPVDSGDGVRVRGGRAAIDAEGAGSTFGLSRDGEAVIGEALVSKTREDTEVDLKKGELSAVLPMKKKSRLKVGDVVLVSDLGGQLTIVKTRNGFELNALAGDIRIERPGAPAAEVPGGKVAQITPDGVKVDDALREVVTLPSKQGLRVFHPGVPRVALTWEGQDKAYQVTVSQEPGLTAPLLQGIVHQRYVNVDAPAKGALFWKIEDEAGNPVDSGSASFSPEIRRTDLERQRNVVSDGSEKTTIFFQDKPPSVTFTYDPDTEAGQYRLSVYKEGQLGSPLVERLSKDEQVVLPEGALGEGSYVWSVTPLGKNNEALRGGRMNKLQIVYDNAVLRLLITTPQNGAAGGRSVPVKGVAPIGSRVVLNGKTIELGEKSRFDTVAAPVGRGVLVFRLFQGAAESITVRTVRRGN
ncbi:MAG: hypothetical protein K1X64_05135 [Myxococcaceae bacterium]|nr:hypothetical protein [Myxococcaceae bacterium]